MKILLSSLLFLVLVIKTYSQGDFSIHLGSSIPVLDFASDDPNKYSGYYGSAAVGASIGIQYLYPLSGNGLGLFGEVDFMYNGIKKSMKNDIEQSLEELGMNNESSKFPKYINIPITAGLNYSKKTDQNIELFANLGLVFNFLKRTDMEIKSDDNSTYSQESDISRNTGLRIGGGAVINDTFIISMSYFGLGKHDVEVKTKTVGINNIDVADYNQEATTTIKVDMLTLTLGIIL